MGMKTGTPMEPHSAHRHRNLSASEILTSSVRARTERRRKGPGKPSFWVIVLRREVQEKKKGYLVWIPLCEQLLPHSSPRCESSPDEIFRRRGWFKEWDMTRTNLGAKRFFLYQGFMFFFSLSSGFGLAKPCRDFSFWWLKVENFPKQARNEKSLQTLLGNIPQKKIVVGDDVMQPTTRLSASTSREATINRTGIQATTWHHIVNRR